MATTIEKRNAAAYLGWLMDWYRGQHVLPALGAGLVIGDETVFTRAAGVRKHGNPAPVQATDRFQLGSITKPMTGMLIARLVHQGVLGWDRTIEQAFPDVFDGLTVPEAWLEHYRKRNIVDLMTHTSGMDYKPRTETDAKLGIADNPPNSTPSQNLPKKRKLYTRLAVQDEPYSGFSSMIGGPPLQKYSGGSIVAAAMAEQALGDTWETLLRNRVFQPLGITKPAFGAMSQKNAVTDIWQHQVQNGAIVAKHIPDESQIAYTHGPAGAVGLSMNELGKWVRALLTEPTSLMAKSVWDEYLTPPASYTCTPGGWFGDGNRLSHTGSNVWNYAVVTIDRGKEMGVFAATNIWTEQAERAVLDLAAEIEAVGDAWGAMANLHEAVPREHVSIGADSVWDNTGTYAPALMSDSWFRTRWASKVATPTITVSLDQPRTVKGVVLCEFFQPRVQAFEVEVSSGQANARPTVLGWDDLEDRTVRQGLVLRTVFETPLRAKSLKVRIKTASDAPTLSRLLVLEYLPAKALDFEIDAGGKLWVVDAAKRRVVTTTDSVAAPHVVLGLDTGGIAHAVRKAGTPPYVIGDDHKVWKGTTTGWVPLGDTTTVQRIAVDAADNTVWSIDAQSRIRRHNGSAWVEHPGGGRAKDLCVHGGTAWVVGTDDKIYKSVATGWQRTSQTSLAFKRIAVDEPSGALWGVATDGTIHSRTANQSAWTVHPGGGKAKAITVHGGVPYVIGMNDGIWKSAGANGWKPLTVLLEKPPPP